MATIQLTSTVTKLEIKKYTSRYPSRYDKSSEEYDIKLLVDMETTNGTPFWFYTPPAKYTVSKGGSYFIAYVSPNDWITQGGDWECEGTFGAKGIGHEYASRIKVGDTITIKGRLKQGAQLWYVKRLDFSYKAQMIEWETKLEQAKERIPTSTGGTRENPVTEPPADIPGVEWHPIGWQGNIFRFDRKIIDEAALLVWAGYSETEAQKPK